jgi:hypothetical protein
MGSAVNWNPSRLPVLGQFFENPAETQKQRSFSEAAAVYHAMRPELQDARMNALRQTMSLYQPVNRALGQMYGPGSQLDISGALEQGPISERAMQLGEPKPWVEQTPEERMGGQGAMAGHFLAPFGGGGIVGQALGRAMGRRRMRRG